VRRWLFREEFTGKYTRLLLRNPDARRAAGRFFSGRLDFGRFARENASLLLKGACG
jgi:hypothetical protein